MFSLQGWFHKFFLMIMTAIHLYEDSGESVVAKQKS